MPLSSPASDSKMASSPPGAISSRNTSRIPNVAQMMKVLTEFAALYPYHTFTRKDLANALRVVATQIQEREREREQERMQEQEDPNLTPRASTQAFTTPNGKTKRGAAENSDYISSPFKRACLTTPPRKVSGWTPINAPSNENARGGNSTSPSSSGDRTLRRPLPGGSSSSPSVQVQRRQQQPPVTPSPMRRHRHMVGRQIPTFSSTAAGSHRKAPPSRLDLSRPGAAPAQTINRATHYVAMPAFLRGPEPHIPTLQRMYDMNPHSGIRLLQKPIHHLQPEDMYPAARRAGLSRGRVDAAFANCGFQIRELPKTPAAAGLAGAFDRFTLGTPMTAQFSTQSKKMHLRAISMALHKAADACLGGGTGDPRDQPTLVIRRTDRILGALNHGRGTKIKETMFDLISALSRVPELAICLGKHLEPRDLLSLYCVSVAFNTQINTWLRHCMAVWTPFWAPDAAEVFEWKKGVHGVYAHLAMADPANRVSVSPVTDGPLQSTIFGGQLTPLPKRVPKIRWYLMVCLRDDVATDILAHLARQGFRCPPGTKKALLKMWMLMDQPTNALRETLLRDRAVFSDQDLLHCQLVLVKLALRLSDPIYGPESVDLLELMLGQRSLYALWEMLFGHRYRDIVSLVQLKIRYDLGFGWHLGRDGARGLLEFAYEQPDAGPVLGVPAHEVGIGYLEHWGARGTIFASLKRPSELVADEAARRQLKFDEHLMGLVIWGHLDQRTGRNLAPSEDEIWMRDSAYKNRAIDTSTEFTPFHCRRARLDELTGDERKRLLLAQQLREAKVEMWDNHRYDEEDLDSEENFQQNEGTKEALLSMAGIDKEDPDLRVDFDGNQLPPDVVPAFQPGPLTAGLQEATDDDGDYESDSSVQSENIKEAVDDCSKFARPWTPKTPDHYQHMPRTAMAEAMATARMHGQGDEQEDDLVDGDLLFSGSLVPEAREPQDMWEIFEEMIESVFANMFQTGSENDGEDSDDNDDYDDDDSDIGDGDI
ncbi:hypothetical protein JX266_006787 [Neoarthrinium moseri]|nr:hypothetical protein JX266_006787 [Neoarthrinium moseri]